MTTVLVFAAGFISGIVAAVAALAWAQIKTGRAILPPTQCGRMAVDQHGHITHS